jgi:hypothetical protein
MEYNNFKIESVLSLLDRCLSNQNIDKFCIKTNGEMDHFYITFSDIENKTQIYTLCVRYTSSKGYVLDVEVPHSSGTIKINSLEHSILYNRFCVINQIKSNLIEKDLNELYPVEAEKIKATDINELDD